MTSDVHIISHRDPDLIATIRDTVNALNGNFSNLPADAWRKMVAEAQGSLNYGRAVKAIAEDIKPALSKIVGSDQILVQSNAYLRATRPSSSAKQEAVGWHRESFYGPNMERAWNVWTPIANVTWANTLQYIPGSAQIPDDEIETTVDEDAETPRFSAGHKIGLLYAPKTIVRGVDLLQAKPMLVPQGASAVFSANLIHGAAWNHTSRVRLSLDFRVLAKADYVQQKQHFASGKTYFTEIEA